MLGLDLQLMTLNGQFIISIEQTNRVGDTKYNIYCSVEVRYKDEGAVQAVTCHGRMEYMWEYLDILRAQWRGGKWVHGLQPRGCTMIDMYDYT